MRALCSWLSGETLFFKCDRGNDTRNQKRKRERPREKGKKRRGDKLQLVQDVKTMPVEGMRAISRVFSQNHCARLHKHTHTHTGADTDVAYEAWLSRHAVVCYQEVEDGGWRRRTIPLSVFTLCLNSRPATEANGPLIYSWMTHTWRLLRIPNRPVTSLCHMCISNIHSISYFSSHSNGVMYIYIHSITFTFI